METFSFLEPPSKEFLALALPKYGIDPEALPRHVHSQEDFLLVSQKHSIFVVADGVTLLQYLVERKPYPNPSPAGEVARIFCERLLRAAEERYETFSESDVQEIFKAGNEAVRAYNQDHGRTPASIDYWETDLYAATAAFAVLKGGTVYWGSMCDASIAQFRNDALLFKSPDCHSKAEAEEPSFTGNPADEKSRAMHVWRTQRNGVNTEGKLIGYGVVTGEPVAERYLSTGYFEVQAGDLITLVTDGFENYLGMPEFISLLNEHLEPLIERVRAFTTAKAKENPEAFGHERSLIAVKI